MGICTAYILFELIIKELIIVWINY